MIYHIRCGGAIRTQVRNSNVFECQVDGTTWTEKLDVWQDCAAHADVPNGVAQSADVESVKRLSPVRDPRLRRVGEVVERDAR